MGDELPRIEPLPRLEPYRDPGVQVPWHRSQKLKIFLIAFFAVIAMGLIWTLLQPVVYRSSATVLMSAPEAIDADVSQANIQNVAIQRTILLGEEIVSSVSGEMFSQPVSPTQFEQVREALHVDPVPDTNLIEMIAQGSQREILPDLVNTWVAVYSDIRAADIEQRKEQTVRQVQVEAEALAFKVAQARDALEAYREQNNIISAKREENEVLARLDGLNKALNNAIEEEVKAKVYLETLRDSLESGQVVVPKDDLRSLQGLENELEQLRAEMVEMSKRYTRDYIQKQPALRAIPERITELESELASRVSEGQAVELANAEQAYSAARRAVLELQQKLDNHKRKVSEFSRIYSTHEALVEDLAGLEELHRAAQERLVQVEVAQIDKYPQVTVIEPSREARRIGPNYLLLLAGTLGAALACAILFVWLYSFLGHEKAQATYVTLSGVHLYPREIGGELAYTSRPEMGIPESSTRRLRAAENGQDAAKTDDEAPLDGDLKRPGGETAQD